ncbi:MAG: helix-turn-helix transcriptional regulator [Bacteroidota bacterium]
MFNTQEFKKDLVIKRVFENKLSMAEAAKQIGISSSCYSALERGEVPAVDTLAKCSIWLNVPIYQIFKIIETLDTHQFQKDLITKRVLENNLSMGKAAKQIGISRATYSRLEGGKLPGVETLAKCIAWLKVPNVKYFQKVKKTRIRLSPAMKKTLVQKNYNTDRAIKQKL